MCGRTTEVAAVGAWVQPGPGIQNGHDDVVQQALMTEQETQEELWAKQERVHRFRREVKQRVQNIERLRREQQLQKACRAMDIESRLLRQSASSAERGTQRKDHCSVRKSNSDFQMKKTNIPLLQSRQDTVDMVPQEEDIIVFEEQKNQVHRFNAHARQHLTSRRLVTDDYVHDNLPGGVWHTGPTRDHPVSRKTLDCQMIETMPMTSTEHLLAGDIEENKENAGDRTVHFESPKMKEETREERISRKSAPMISGTQIYRVPIVPDINPGIASEADKRFAQKQRATFRRLFMDIEREQVKENARRLEHRRHIKLLKQEKENERRQVEQMAVRFAEPTDPVSGRTAEESLALEQAEEQAVRHDVEKRQQQVKKSRETERFLDALKIRLREKIEKKNVDLPALCSCGPSLWDTNPLTCANNCIFYKNPKAYARALQSLLESCDVV
ncbi:hypothetical protein LSAT2_018411 [Lamellibrachia satsuma]|nr:hypothetical protein LSAT2_018411 [Lamellibrachia satsuma]